LKLKDPASIEAPQANFHQSHSCPHGLSKKEKSKLERETRKERGRREGGENKRKGRRRRTSRDPNT